MKFWGAYQKQDFKTWDSYPELEKKTTYTSASNTMKVSYKGFLVDPINNIIGDELLLNFGAKFHR